MACLQEMSLPNTVIATNQQYESPQLESSILPASPKQTVLFSCCNNIWENLRINEVEQTRKEHRKPSTISKIDNNAKQNVELL